MEQLISGLMPGMGLQRVRPSSPSNTSASTSSASRRLLGTRSCYEPLPGIKTRLGFSKAVRCDQLLVTTVGVF